MGKYLHMVADYDNSACVLLCSDQHAVPGYLAEFADGNIGKVIGSMFFTSESIAFLEKAEAFYNCEKLYCPIEPWGEDH